MFRLSQTRAAWSYSAKMLPKALHPSFHRIIDDNGRGAWIVQDNEGLYWMAIAISGAFKLYPMEKI